MSKVVGSYPSVILGVSEQVPQDRRPGQHFEQVNMISDPVKGLARRHGSVLQDDTLLTEDTSVWADAVADTADHKEFTFFVDGVEYALIYRSTQAVPGTESSTFAWCINKDTKQFVPIVTNEVDALLDDLREGGVSAAANVGKYIYLAGNTIVPTYDGVDRWGAEANKNKLAAWVRGGAYSRTFKIALTEVGGGTVSVEYKTKPAAYPELLDTSDILSSNPDYQKLVNDRVNAYNSAVTAYIGEAAEDITPENIATKLAEALALEGVSCNVINSTVVVYDSDYAEIAVDDGGDGTLFRGVGNEVEAVDLVSVLHWAGKIVKVRPKKQGGEDALFLEAIPKIEGATGWVEVSWRETAGYQMTPNEVFVHGTVKSGNLYLAGSPALLDTLTGDDNPTYSSNTVGDDITAPIPSFFGKRINYLGVFQDRLVIGYGATLMHSRPGDYLNWFRRSVLTVEDTDAFEMYALGSEDDFIHSSVPYDRSVVYFGERQQYAVSGRQKLVPSTASITTIMSNKDATDAAPAASGNFVFYGQVQNNKATLHQIQTGVVAESPESYEMSGALESYLQGTPVQIVPITSPNLVFLRTTAYRYGVYCYAYLDNASGAERIFDSWSRWEWDVDAGVILGVTAKNKSLMILTLRQVIIDDAPQLRVVLDEFSLETSLSTRPYLDSLRPFAVGGLTDTNAFAAFADSSEYRWLGTPWDNLESFLTEYSEEEQADIWAGFDYPAGFIPTNPYLRDQNDRPVVTGRLTLSRVLVSVADTGGLAARLETTGGTREVASFNGRVLGQSVNQVSRQPIVTSSISVPIGKEVRDCKYSIWARKWLPLTVTGIEWVGQSFNNSRRV